MSIVEIPAVDLARVLPFRASEDVRYYLNGILIEPFDGGCMLVATNGHLIAALHSNAARADQARILSVSSAFDKALREAVANNYEVKVSVADATARTVLAGGCEHYIEPGSPFIIEGKYPEWRKVIPAIENLKPGLFAPLQTAYVSLLQKAMARSDHCPGIKFWHDSRNPETGSVLARFNKCPELIVVIMPVREFGNLEWPAWMAPLDALDAALKDR